MKWSAVLAPLAVESGDGRLLAGDFTIARDGPVPLFEDVGCDPPQIGTVDHVEVRGGALVASGTVDDPAVAARMGNGELSPQMELRDFVHRYQGGRVIFSSGVLAAVRAGGHPAWPEARFSIQAPAEDPWQAAR